MSRQCFRLTNKSFGFEVGWVTVDMEERYHENRMTWVGGAALIRNYLLCHGHSAAERSVTQARFSLAVPPRICNEDEMTDAHHPRPPVKQSVSTTGTTSAAPSLGRMPTRDLLEGTVDEHIVRPWAARGLYHVLAHYCRSFGKNLVRWLVLLNYGGPSRRPHSLEILPKDVRWCISDGEVGPGLLMNAKPYYLSSPASSVMQISQLFTGHTFADYAVEKGRVSGHTNPHH